MRRETELVVLALVAQAVAVWLQGLMPAYISTLTDASELIATAVGMTATAAVASVLAWRALRPTPAGPSTGLLFVLVGGFMAYAWPLSFALALPMVGALVDWWRGAALPVWEGAMTVALGASLLVRWMLERQRVG